MREGRIRPSLAFPDSRYKGGRRCRNEGGANSPLVEAQSADLTAAPLCRNEGGANSPLVGARSQGRLGRREGRNEGGANSPLVAADVIGGQARINLPQ